MYDSKGPCTRSKAIGFSGDFSKTLPAMQEIGYQPELAPWFQMARKLVESPVSVALAAFARNVEFIRRADRIASQSELARMVSRASTGPKAPTTKTINNALNKKHSAKIGTLDAIANGLKVPLWVLFVPELKEEELTSPNRERFIAVVRDYLECDDEGRQHTESMAKAFAAKARAKRG